jgi:beta-galactosidase/beta-glucuronidase
VILDQIATAPNPQFARLPWIDLCGTWDFAFDDADDGLRDGWYKAGAAFKHQIEVPFPPESERSGIGDPSFHRICWYRRPFDDPRTGEGERVLLRFGAVDYSATVWINGTYVGSHEGGSTPFSLDITPALGQDAAAHTLTVRVVDDPADLEQPRGKQDWREEPHGIFYRRTTGIWQPVWLEVVPAIWVEDLRSTFDRSQWTVRVEAALSDQAGPGSSLSVELETGNGSLAKGEWSASGRTLRGSIDLRSASGADDLSRLLWSPESPTLLGARVTLRSPGKPDDVVLSYVGLRTIEVRETGFSINGRSHFLRFVLSQGFWPESHLAAPSRDAIEREIKVIRSLGFNGARLHQKAEDPRLLYEADRKGLLLWGEIGNAFTYSDRAIERHAREWRDIVVRDRNHPSIIAWVPFNESWGVEDLALRADQQHAVRAAYHLTHALDGTRPVIGNDGWENVAGDITTAHDYSWDPNHLRELYGPEATLSALLERFRSGQRSLTVGGYSGDGNPVMLTEFGGVSFAPGKGENWYGYGTVRSAEEFVERLRALVDAVSPPALISGFCYTQLTDTLQETNGLLTESREPKVPIEVLHRIISGGSDT